MTTRRQFLATAASGTAAAVIAPAALISSEDPIFAAIEAHRSATKATNAVFRVQSDLEKTLPKERRQSSITEWEEKIIETDAPEWVASERAIIAAHDVEIDATVELASISPTTTAGAAAILA